MAGLAGIAKALGRRDLLAHESETAVLKSERFGILRGGAAVLAVLAALLVYLVRGHLSWPEALLFPLAVVLAPVYLVGMRVSESSPTLFGVPTWLLVTSVLAIAGVASHPIAPRPATATLAVIGLVAWALCMLFVAGSVV